MALRTDDVSTVLFSRVTLGVFAVTGTVVALAEWGLLPREALLVGAPAIAAALLLDTFLYNEFLIGSGRATLWIWLEVYTFLYVQAVLVGAITHALEPYWDEHVATRG